MKPTVFITDFHPFITKNILNTGVLDLLTKEARVVLFVAKPQEEYFKIRYPGVIVEGVELGKNVTSFRNRLFQRLAEWLLDTNVMWIHKLEARTKTGNWPKYYTSLLFTALFAPITPVKKFLRFLDYRLNNQDTFNRYVETYRPSVVFATDLFNHSDLFLLKNAKARGVRTVAMVRSWDNTTSRSYARFVPDRLIVHNEVMKEDMVRYHHIKETTIVLSGVPQFEKYLTMQPTPREEFFKKIGADPKKRLVLFAPAGHFFIDTDWQTCQILKDLFAEKKIPDDLQILVRLHPFLPVDLSKFTPDEHFIIDIPGPAKLNDLERDKREGELDMSFFQHIYDSLYWSSLVINTISSIIIDSSIFDKPLITINFDGWETKVPFLRSLVRRWRLEENQVSWLSIGSTALVGSKGELAKWINIYLAHPEIHSDRRKVFKDRYCWKFDGMSASHIASAVLSFIS